MMTSHEPFTPSIENPAVPCWPVLELALSQLLPPPNNLSTPSGLASDDFLKFYTLVFEHCVGSVEVKKGGSAAAAAAAGGGLNICGEELYLTLKTFLQLRFNQWSQSIRIDQINLTKIVLLQLDRLQAAEKPLTFIFTYLERHWIDRQINEPRVDILPMKQLLWSLWDDLVLEKIFSGLLMVEVGDILRGLRDGSQALEEMEPLARMIHYLRVISHPTQLESDFKATKRTVMAGAVVNPHALHRDRFTDFVHFYCQGLNEACEKICGVRVSDDVDGLVQRALQFWNDEEGRMAFLRFDKPAQISVRNHLKSLLLLPNLDAFRGAFRAAILNWNVLAANAIYRLLANRKSLLLHLDAEAEAAFLAKGRVLLQDSAAITDSQPYHHFFINTLGQFYSRLGELIQTALASRPEIFEARSKALRGLLNSPPNTSGDNGGCSKSFAPRSLARFADYIIRNFSQDFNNNENLNVLIALFRLIDEKEEFLETFGKLLGLRLLSGATGRHAGPFEGALLSQLREICGPATVKSFDRMYEDLRDQRESFSVSTSLTVLTAGSWNIRGKILPGHALFQSSDASSSVSTLAFPTTIANQLALHARDYHAKHPKRKLMLSPLLSEIEFSIAFGLRSITIRGNCLHLSMLQSVAAGVADKEALIAGPFHAVVFNSLLQSNLISNASGGIVLNDSCATCSDDIIDLYSLVLEELIFTTNSTGQYRTNHSNSNNINQTPRPASSSVLGTPHPTADRINPVDKSILLQCAVTRILKQLRVLSLDDLFNRLSMLPKLLARFSPSVNDLLDALKQLHEKEFVKLAVGTGIDDLVDIGGDTANGPILGLDSIETYTDRLFIKYLA